MTVNWLIAQYKEDDKKIAQIIEYLGYPVKMVGKYDNMENQHWAEAYPDESCVVFMGSLQFARDVFEQSSWYPGSLLDESFFRYRRYSQHILPYLLNFPYSITTYKAFRESHDHWFNCYGNSDCIFVRPDSGFKIFTGQVLYKERKDRLDEWEQIPDDSLIIVSEPRNIIAEYRAVIVQGKVISTSMYKAGSKHDEACIDSYDMGLVDFAEKVAQDIPHEVYVMDIAEVTEGFKVIELNSFSCSGMYQCDMMKVIPAVSEWAEKDYELYYGQYIGC